MLRMQLDPSVQVDSVVFGLPRVGNQEFADMVDSMVCSLPRVSKMMASLTRPRLSSRDLSFSFLRSHM